MRFAQGELARFVVARTSSGMELLGDIVEIKVVGPLHVGDHFVVFGIGYESKHDGDYIISPAGGRWDFGMAMDWQLQKLDPKDEPASLTHREEETT